MTKKFNATAVLNELAGQSAFFADLLPSVEPPATEAQKVPVTGPQNSSISAPVMPPKSPQDENPSNATSALNKEATRYSLAGCCATTLSCERR